MSNYTLFNVDILDYKHDGKPFQGVLTDPPYGLAFMGKSWDKYNPKEFQQFCYEWGSHILKMVYPATVLLCFGGTRTFHRMVCGLEDAGWEIFDAIIAWTYGNGFPKSANSKVYEGYGTALKPSYEIITIARAPRQGYTYAECLEQFGTGSLNIDGTRVLIGEQWGSRPTMDDIRRASFFTQDTPQIRVDDKQNHDEGRWGANTILVHHPNCSDDVCVPDCHVHIMGEQSGELDSRPVKPENIGVSGNGQTAQYRTNSVVRSGHYDTGTASRFFYQAKAPKWERDKGLSGIDEQRSEQTYRSIRTNRNNGYDESSIIRNIHPTVKPIQLTTYLATMIRPPLEHKSRRLLVPFSGSGSEMIGGYFGGWSDIVGIELDPEYIDIAEQRLKWWLQFENYQEAEHNHLSKMSINQEKLL